VAASKNTEREAREARERLRRYNARQAVHQNQQKRRRRDNLLAVGSVVVIAALAAVAQVFFFNGGPGTPTPEPSSSASAAPAGVNVGNVPDPSFAEGKTWTGTLGLNEVTLGITLDGALAPQAVASMLADSLSGYYVGKTCHRLLSSPSAGLLQCGSLDGTGASDPSYSFGPIENAPADGIYPAGTIAIARGSNDAYSNGRQFFIVFQEASLPADSAGGYTVVGQVTSGLDDLLGQIANAGTADGSSDGPPLIATSITSFTIQ
jgi:peptidyl-prolyl cis-trans isomerase B (cyclophilin B)